MLLHRQKKQSMLLRKRLSQKRLRTLLRYYPKSGKWIWLTSVGSVKPGRKTGTGFHIQIDGKKYMTSRLAYLYMTGHWPILEIDHADLNKKNHRWANLREATRQQQCVNRRSKFKNNKTGFKGVRKHPLTPNCWQAFFARKRLGHAHSPEEAFKLYQDYVEKTFGEFARC